MPNTFTLIASDSVPNSSSLVSITLSSIPSTYDDLCIKAYLRTQRAAVEENMYLFFNSSDIGTTTVLRGIPGTGIDSFNAGDSYKATINAANSTGSVYTNCEFYIPNYTAAVNKGIIYETAMEQNAATAHFMLGESLWNNTSAITSLTFRLQFNQFAQFSSVYLYGIKNS